jgi:hypothetical protein
MTLILNHKAMLWPVVNYLTTGDDNQAIFIKFRRDYICNKCEYLMLLIATDSYLP